jgi:tetratricopeptide (TPR) repeat protein
LANGDATKLLALVEDLAVSGDYPSARAIYNALPEPRPAIKLAERAADISLERGDKGREMLPAEWRADHDRIRKAFLNLAAGRDDEVRTELQAIGLQSPFADWKLLLRGLLAYYQNEDARALENWHRLDMKLLPGRLASLFRFQIDPEFRAAQSPDAQNILRRQSEKLHNDLLIAGLRRIQSGLTNQDNWDWSISGFHQLIANVQQMQPEILPKLANCFYWHAISHGEFDVAAREHRRWFAPPPEDPDLSRMEALMYESEKDFDGANQCWKRYADALPRLTHVFPGAENAKAQAMVWHRMGVNASMQQLSADVLDSMPSFLFGMRKPPIRKPTQQPAEYFRQAIRLAPAWRTPYVSLLECHRDQNDIVAAIQVCQQMLEFDPDDIETIQTLVALLRSSGRHSDAVGLLERALELNPLLSELRLQLMHSRHCSAIALAREGSLDAAKAILGKAMDSQPDNMLMQLCHAAFDYLGGENERADLQIQRIWDANAKRPAVSAYMLALATALKLPKPVKTRFEKEFKDWISTEPTPATASSLAWTFSNYVIDNFEYYGMQSHRKKVMTYVQTTVAHPYSIDELRLLGIALLVLKEPRLLKRFSTKWKLQHRDAPEPLYFDAESRLMGDDNRWPIWRVRPLLTKAKKKLEALDRQSMDPFLVNLRKKINERLSLFDEMEPPLGPGRPMNPFFDSPFDADRDDGEDDW